MERQQYRDPVTKIFCEIAREGLLGMTLPCFLLFYFRSNGARLSLLHRQSVTFREHNLCNIAPSVLSTPSGTDVMGNPPKTEIFQGVDPKSTFNWEAIHLVSSQENYCLLSHSNLGYILSVDCYHFIKS